ncbi:hypothetical protein M9H77_02214 [Catharanthus roseus]|uniref:Uncharacterized protein n=1 Tax=Catharanthus roseus TaxID=4058 RepID=A0ACC0C7Z3_CATRO|nr:hypothetical protein M9H77_02214 [Catharanthus roseus]
MSTEAQLPTSHNEGTSESPHSNLDPILKVIMQEFQQIRKDMTDMRRDITNLSMEHRDRRTIYNPHGPYDSPVQSTHQFYDGGRHTTPKGGRHGGLGDRGYEGPHEEFQKEKSWHEDNLEIEHQIDLVPSAVLPNRPAYRSPLEETKELRRQVEELLSKG